MCFAQHIVIRYTVRVKGRLRTADCGLRTADCGPGVKCRLSVKCRLQTESKTQAGVKCRPSINCSRGRVYGQIKSRKNICKQTLT